MQEEIKNWCCSAFRCVACHDVGLEQQARHPDIGPHPLARVQPATSGPSAASPTAPEIADGGQTFANYAWTSTPFDPGDEFIGDYAGIAALKGRVFGVWTYGETVALPRPVSNQNRARAIRVPRRPITIVQLGIAEFQPTAK